VLFIHGVSLVGDTKADCAGWWQRPSSTDLHRMARGLDDSGWNGFDMRYISYYWGDSNCSDHGDGNTIEHHGTYKGKDGHHWHNGTIMHGMKGHVGASHDWHAYIQHLSYHLAWYIYDHYSRHGIFVDVVAHSMGGLMINYAMAKTQKRDPVTLAGDAPFPPRLLVEDVLTLGTPHTGAQGACDYFEVFEVKQAQQMCHDPRISRNDNFLPWMAKHAMNPQGEIGTDWTMVGSDHDGYVGFNSGLGWVQYPKLNRWFRDPAHRVRLQAAGTRETHIGHSDYSRDTADYGQNDRTAYSWNRHYGYWVRSKTRPHMTEWADSALYYWWEW
jgi:hypothetical protein